MASVWRRIYEGVRSNPIISAVILALVPAAVLSLLSISEPNLLHVARKPLEPPVIAMKEDKGNLTFHIKLWAEFKNSGLKSGHVADVKISPEGLCYFPDVKLTYLDQGDISWLHKKRVLCEFLVTVNPNEALNACGKEVRYRVVYYGVSGNQLYVQGVKLFPTKIVFPEHSGRMEGANQAL